MTGGDSSTAHSTYSLGTRLKPGTFALTGSRLRADVLYPGIHAVPLLEVLPTACCLGDGTHNPHLSITQINSPGGGVLVSTLNITLSPTSPSFTTWCRRTRCC